MTSARSEQPKTLPLEARPEAQAVAPDAILRTAIQRRDELNAFIRVLLEILREQEPKTGLD